MVERTLIFIKPDAIEKRLIGRIVARFEEKGFTIVDIKMEMISSEKADLHYQEHLEKPFYPSLKTYITSAPVVMLVLESENAVGVVRRMVGATDGAVAEPGTIRGDFSISKSENGVHASDSVQSAQREIGIFFPHLLAS